MVVSSKDMAICDEVEFPNICSTLIDKKVHLGEKINLLNQVKKTESEYDQIIIDWICSTIEYVSNTEKYINLNSADINELLVLLNHKLKTNASTTTREVILNPNIFEVLTRFFSVSSSIINCESLLSTWYLLLQNESWKENLANKSNIASLGWYCESFIGNQGCLDDKVILNVVEKLLECYLHHIKSQYVSRKVFAQFCNQLLIKLMCMYAVPVEHGSKVESINLYIDKLVALVICSREHLANLKTVLKSVSSTEVPTKKRKLDDTSISTESDTTSERKGRTLKDDTYFNLVFNELIKAKPDVSNHLLKALPRIYKAIISSARSSESSLTHTEEFYLLIKLSECLNLGLDLTSLNVLGELFDVVIKYDIYQNVEDNAIGNIFHKWMADYTHKFISGGENSDTFKKLTLKIMFKILNINHLVLEPVLPKIWNMCLQYGKDESSDLQNIKESFLCELLDTYEKLHQLDSLFSTFGVAEFQNDLKIIYPQKFHQRFQKSISSLLTVQINAFLDIYLSKLKDLNSSINKDNNVVSTAWRIQHETYLLCYLVLMNASVIPGNGYRKPELELLIKKLRMLKVAANEFVDIVTGCQRDQTTQIHLQALVQHGINNIIFILKEFSLIEDEDCDLIDFDLSTICGGDDTNDPIMNYLKATLCFDRLNEETVSKDILPIIQKLYEDACGKVIDSPGKWNGQVLGISTINYCYALVKLFEENLATILAFNNKSIISLGIDLTWKWMLLSDKDENKECSSMLQILPCYNNTHFQISLLESMHHSLKDVINDQLIDIGILLKEDVDAETIVEVKNKFSCKKDISDDINVSEVDEQLCLTILKVIKKLPLIYFTEQNLCALSLMVLRVWQKFNKSNNEQINLTCIQIIGDILEIYTVGNHSICHLPLCYILESNLQYSCQKKMTAECELHLTSSCISAITVIVKYVGKDDNVISNICSQILIYLSEEISSPIMIIMEKMLSALCKMVKEPTIKSRCENTAYQIVSTLSECLLKMISHLPESSSSHLFSIFANLCQITQHAQVRKNQSSPLKSLENELVNVCPVVIKSIHVLLESEARSDECKHLQVMEFLYSSSNKLTLELRKLLDQPEKDIVSVLIKNAEKNSTIASYAHLIANIVLRVDQDILVELLDNLTEKLVIQFKKPNKTPIMTVWCILLTAKWEKEQRIVLWDYLPKVMLTCVHMSKVLTTIEEVRLLLRLLTAVVNIGKNSLMSQYVNIIYHMFVILPEKVKDSKYNSFVDLFEEMYQLASQLLFHHQATVYSSLHAYINVVNSTLEILLSYSASDAVQQDDLQKCCERMARLYRELGTHKGIISKYSSFVVARFIRTCLSSPLSASSKKILESGVNCIMDTCTETELSFLNTTLEKADKEYFKIIKNNYEKHHKFTGKA